MPRRLGLIGPTARRPRRLEPIGVQLEGVRAGPRAQDDGRTVSVEGRPLEPYEIKEEEERHAVLMRMQRFQRDVQLYDRGGSGISPGNHQADVLRL